MKRSLTLLLIWIVAGSFLSATPALAERCQDLLDFEREAIRTTVVNNEFRVSRVLTKSHSEKVPGGEISYEVLAGQALLPRLRAGAAKGKLWIDIGIGEGRAIEEALRSPDLQGLRIHGIAPYSPLHVVNHWQSLKRLHGAKVTITHDLLETVAARLQGSAAIATDIYGALSYRTDFDRALKEVLSTLEESGELFFVLQKFISNSDLFTKILDQNGNPLTMETYLRRIRGVEWVSSEITADRSAVFHVRRTADPLVVPKLKLTHLDGDKTPPRRTYVLTK